MSPSPTPSPPSPVLPAKSQQLLTTSAMVTTPSQSPEPPALPYSIRDHKGSILLIWSLLTLDSFILPLALFYPLWYTQKETHLNEAIIFAITTSVFGIISGLEWAFRSWQLMTTPHVRPLDVEGPPAVVLKKGTWYKGLFDKQRYYWSFDFFHFSYSIGYLVALAELIIGASPHQPFIRLCAAPSPSFITSFGIIILTLTACHHFNFTLPFRVSSSPPHAAVRPATYTIVEDVLSVDTGVGKRYRRAFRDRYESSPRFRRLLRQMDVFWGVPALLLGVGLLATIGHPGVEQTKAYGLGWGLPPVWAMIWAAITTVWVKISLWREKKVWKMEHERDEEKRDGPGESFQPDAGPAHAPTADGNDDDARGSKAENEQEKAQVQSETAIPLA